MKCSSQVVSISYLAVSVFVLREALLSPGSIGLLHDWSAPIYPEQLRPLLITALSSWSPASLGFYINNIDVFFKFILVFVGSAHLISLSSIFKLSLVLLIFISGLSTYWLSRYLLCSSEAASALAGLFYMLTPVVFTRVIVGYYYYLIGYALLPLVLYSFAVGVQKKSHRHLLLCGLLFGISAMQIQFVAIIPITLAMYLIFDRKNAVRGVTSLLFVILIFSLVQLPLIYYLVENMFFSGDSLASMAGTAKFFWLYFFAPSLPKALMLFGRDYEFLFLLYFQNKYLFIPFLIVAVSIPVIIFSAFSIPKARLYVVLALMALFLMKGPNPPLGWLYQWAYQVFPFSALFRTSYHWSVLAALCYAILMAMAYDEIRAGLKERARFVKWLRSFVLVSALVLSIYIGYAISNSAMLAFSFEKRGIPSDLAYILMLAAFILLLISYFKAGYLVDRILQIRGWATSENMVLFLLFLTIILVYSWPLFTGDFADRLQLYEYDDAYHDLYQELQEESGDFRILWLPMTQPMVYNGSTYSGHDILIGGASPKPSFDQDLAHFSDSARYTAFLANLINTRKTEKFGGILDYSSTKYAIYRGDFESVLPEYLPFGSVEGFDWDNVAPLTFLENQKDLELKKVEEKIYIFENDYVPHISAQTPVLVGGDLSTIISLSYSKEILDLKHLPALFFLEDENQDGYQKLANTVIFDGDSYFDLAASFVDDRYKFDAGWYAGDLDARSGWTNAFRWWWYDFLMSSQIEYGALSLNGTESPLEVETGLPPGEYRILAKFRTGPEGSMLEFASGENVAKVITFERAESYRWHDLGRFNLTDGDITIKGSGKNVVQRLLVAPETEIEAARSEAARYMANGRAVLLFELERFDASNALQDFGSSQGYISLSSSEEIAFTSYVPKEDFYEIHLRAANDVPVTAYFSIDDKTSDLSLPPSEFRWTFIDRLFLEEGYHKIAIRSSSPLNLDLLLLKPSKIPIQAPDAKVTSNQTAHFGLTDPTRYLVNLSTEKTVLLVFNEAYHPCWKLSDSTGKTFDHYKVNSYANGYLVDKAGNLSLTLEFSKQKNYEMALIVSQMSILFIIIYLIWYKFVGYLKSRFSGR